MAGERGIRCVELWRKVIHRVWKPLCNSVFPQSVDNFMHSLTDVGEIRCSQAQPGQYSHEPHRSTGRHCRIATGYLHCGLVNSTTLALGKTGGTVLIHRRRRGDGGYPRRHASCYQRNRCSDPAGAHIWRGQRPSQEGPSHKPPGMTPKAHI